MEETSKKKLIEALRALRNAAEDAGNDKIAKRATLDLAMLTRVEKAAPVTVDVEAPTGAK